MKKILFSLAAAAALLLTAACSNDDIADDMPVITDEGITANPVDCQVYNRGDKIPFRYRFTDNEELGNYNIEIHNNFDHHTHGTQASSCSLDPKKKAVKPWIYNQDYKIPHGLKAYDASQDTDSEGHRPRRLPFHGPPDRPERQPAAPGHGDKDKIKPMQ